MPMLRELAEPDRFAYLVDLGIDPDDAGRLDVLAGTAAEAGFAVNVETGESRLLNEGDPIPAGIWVAQRDIDVVRPGPGSRDEPHGFGEGFGAQGAQVGGDRAFPEEDTGGTRRASDPETGDGTENLY